MSQLDGGFEPGGGVNEPPRRHWFLIEARDRRVVPTSADEPVATITLFISFGLADQNRLSVLKLLSAIWEKWRGKFEARTLY